MEPKDGPTVIDALVIIFSPLIVVVLTVVHLVGWWVLGRRK